MAQSSYFGDYVLQKQKILSIGYMDKNSYLTLFVAKTGKSLSKGEIPNGFIYNQ